MVTPKPYIGISGMMTDGAMNALGGVALRCRRAYQSDYMFANGVLISSKTLRGEINKWPKRYPKIDTTAAALPVSGFIYNFAHFNTDEPWDLFRSLVRIKEICGPHLHGFQLNIAWPSADAIRLYRLYDPDAKFIVQIGEKAFAQFGNNPARITVAIASYRDVADYALLDPSGGKGVSFEPVEMQRYLDVIYSYGVQEYMGIGIAGGLGPDSVGATMEHFFSQYPNLSIDAEGKLRDSDDSFNFSKGELFLENAYKALSRT